MKAQLSITRKRGNSARLVALSVLLLTALASPLTAQDSMDVIAQTLSGEEITGKLKQLDDRQLVLETAEGDRSYAVENLLQVSPVNPTAPVAAQPEIWVQLLDGTQLTGSAFAADEGRCTFQAAGQDVRVAVRMMGHVRFRDLDERLMAQWEDALSKAGASDLIVVRAGDNLDYLDVVVKSVTPEEVSVEVDGQPRTLSRDRVDGLIFGHASIPEFGDPLCILDAGVPVRARSFQLADEGLQVLTQSGVRVTLGFDTIRNYDFSAGKLMYLGDVEPDAMNVVKYLGPAFPLELEMHKPRRNQSPDGQPITIENQVYRKGLGVRSKTELIYRLRGAYSRFEAIAGIDDEVRGKGGHVRLLIRGDDKVLFDEMVDDARGAIPLELDVSGVNRLTILVDFGQNQGFADHLDLANARVVK